DLAPVGLHRGALGVLKKPVSRDQLEALFKRIQAVGERKQRRILSALGGESADELLKALKAETNAQIIRAESPADLTAEIEKTEFDALVIDGKFGGNKGIDILSQVVKDS